MIVMTVIDDRGGMLFNRRRQSQDRVLREKMLALAGTHPFRMNAYSARQFHPEELARSGADVRVEEDFLDRAEPGDFCFAENVPLSPYLEEIEELCLFHWNRAYPGDFFLDLAVAGPDWRLASREDFPGYSHEKITMERYIHEKRQD